MLFFQLFVVEFVKGDVLLMYYRFIQLSERVSHDFGGRLKVRAGIPRHPVRVTIEF